MVAWACLVRVGLLVVDAMLASKATSYQVNSGRGLKIKLLCADRWGLVRTQAQRLRLLLTDHCLTQGLTGFAQAGGVNAHGYRLAQNIEQNHRAALGIGVLIDGFKPSKRAIGNRDVVASGEQRLRMCPLFT